MKKLLFGLVGIALAIFVTSCKHPAGAPEEKPTTLKGRINAAKDNDVIDLGIEELTFDEKDSFTITKPLTIKGGNAKNATFVVQSKGVKLDSINHVDAVIVGEKVADGEFTLSNCYNVDEVYVNGGGSNSVHFANTMIKKLTVNKKNVRIALDDDKDGATKIEKAYILQDCKLESDNKANSFESVVISEAVKSLDLAGSAVINEIVSTAAKNADGNVNITINVTVSVEIKSVDNDLKHDNFTAVDETGQEVTGAVAFDTTTIKFEDKTDIKKDAITEIFDEIEKTEEHLKPTYTINLTKYLYGGVFYRDQFSKDEDGKPAFVLGFDITKAFMDNGGLPKTGDVVEFTIDATFSETLPKMSILFADNSEKAEWWKQLAEGIAYDDIGIEAGKEVSFTKKAAFFDYPVEQVYMQLMYSSQDLYAETVFKPKDWNGITYKVDLTDLVEVNKFSVDEYLNYGMSFGITDVLKQQSPDERLPKKGDIIELTLEGKFSNDLDDLMFGIGDWNPNATTNAWHRLCNDSYIDTKNNPIKAYTPVKLTKKVGVAEDGVGIMTAGISYPSQSYRAALFTKKNWSGTIKKIDAEQIIWPTKFIIDTYDYKDYKAEYNVTPIFDPLPKAGDIYQVVFKGTFDRDLANLRIDFNDLSPAADYYLNLTDWKTGAYTGIKANEEFEFDDYLFITHDAVESVTMRVVYTANDANGKDIGAAEFTSGDFENIKKFPADFSGDSGENTVILDTLKESWEQPFSFKGSDLDLGKWYKITYNIESSFVRDEAKPAEASFKVTSNGDSGWKGDYVNSPVEVQIGEKQTVEYYICLENPVDYLSPACNGCNVVVIYDSATIEEAPDYVPPKANL